MIGSCGKFNAFLSVLTSDTFELAKIWCVFLLKVVILRGKRQNHVFMKTTRCPR
jgi:hypothetical protein